MLENKHRLTAKTSAKLQRLKDDLPLHGGDIVSAAYRYAIPVEDWIDLSTGINPEPYPVSGIPEKAFQDLPYWQPEFLEAAEDYYQQKHFLPIAGSQAVIQVLPDVLNEISTLSVLIPEVGYQEHARQWQRRGNALVTYKSILSEHMGEALDEHLASGLPQHLVVIQPNNPTSASVKREQLCLWASKLAPSAYLIVDEAFMDMEPENSLLGFEVLPSNIIVLRSFGKFFGLAGIRLGFVFAHQSILRALQDKLGLWQVNGPAQTIATKAMRDIAWQHTARDKISVNGHKTAELFAPLSRYFICAKPLVSSLFLSYSLSLMWALALNDALAKSGILTRVVICSDEAALLRVGCVNINDLLAVQYIKNVVDVLRCVDGLEAMLEIDKSHFQ